MSNAIDINSARIKASQGYNIFAEINGNRLTLISKNGSFSHLYSDKDGNIERHILNSAISRLKS